MRSRHFLIYSGPFFRVEFGGDVRNAISRRNRDFFGIFCDSWSKTLSWCRVCAATNARLASKTTARPVGSRYETQYACRAIGLSFLGDLAFSAPQTHAFSLGSLSSKSVHHAARGQERPHESGD